MAPQPASTETLARYLTTGYWQDMGEIPQRFDTRGSNVITVNLTGLTAEGQALARAALDAWESIANVVFRETTGRAQITFDDNQAGAFSSSQYTSAGFIQSATVNVSTAWLAGNGTTVGSYSFFTYMHEIGHALGLGHAGPYNGGGTFGSSAIFQNDSWQSSVMSYFHQDENTYVNASKAVCITPMMADVMAIQSIYGAPRGGASAGDTRWGLGSDLGTYLDAFWSSGPRSLARASMTIYDEGGTDTLDFSNDTAAQRVNLGAGQFSDVYGKVGNLGIATNTTVENYRAGSGSDTVTGNGAANLIRGNAGNDRIDGQGGNDRLEAGTGNDSLFGAAGDDHLFGEDGNDRLDGGDGADSLSGGRGLDTLVSGAGNDFLDGGDDRDMFNAGSGNDVVKGGNGDDDLIGGTGDDRLEGGAGNDALRGEAGRDAFVFSGGRDVVRDFENNVDEIRIDDALFGGRLPSVSDLVARFQVSNGSLVLDLGGGNVLTVAGVTDRNLLADDLVFV